MGIVRVTHAAVIPRAPLRSNHFDLRAKGAAEHCDVLSLFPPEKKEKIINDNRRGA